MSALNPESRFQTPNLDRLAREGLLFTDGHAADTVFTASTRPTSRCASGEFAGRNKAGAYDDENDDL